MNNALYLFVCSLLNDKMYHASLLLPHPYSLLLSIARIMLSPTALQAHSLHSIPAELYLCHVVNVARVTTFDTLLSGLAISCAIF